MKKITLVVALRIAICAAAGCSGNEGSAESTNNAAETTTTAAQSTYLHVIKEAEARVSSILTDTISASVGLKDTESRKESKDSTEPPKSA